MRNWIIAAGLTLTFASATAYADPATERLWKAKCGNCHGADGKGATQKGKEQGIADMTTPEWKKEFTEAKIKDATRKGLQREKNGKKQKMDAYGADKIKDDQLDALAKFIVGLK